MTRIGSASIAPGAVPLEQTQVKEGQQEGVQAGSARAALSDATGDPGSFVEQTASYVQSEAVEAVLTTLVTNVVVQGNGGESRQAAPGSAEGGAGQAGVASGGTGGEVGTQAGGDFSMVGMGSGGMSDDDAARVTSGAGPAGAVASQAMGGLTQGGMAPAGIDEDTGQVIPGGTGSAGSGTGEAGAEQPQGGSGGTGGAPGTQTPLPGVGTGQAAPGGGGEGGQAASSEGAGSAAIPALDGSSAEPAEKAAAGAGGGLVPEELPEQARLPVGEGTQGMIEKPGAGHGLGAPELPEKYGGGPVNQPGMGKGTSSGGYGKPGTVTGNVPGGPRGGGRTGGKTGGSGKTGGTSSSDSGPPIGYGLGGKGKGGDKGGSGGNDTTSKLCRYKDTLEMQGWTCKKENGKTWCYSPDGKSKSHSAAWDRCYTLDGDQPLPYTGKSFGGEEPEDPGGPIGGKDHESGSFFVVVTRGGKGVGGGSGGDEPGVEGDSGRFYGGVWGSSGIPRPPDDDIPYNVVG